MSSIAVTSVTTEDSAPTAAPHRVSLASSYRTATVVLALAPPPAGSFGAVRLTTGLSRTAPAVIAKRGTVCGIDRCGEPSSFPMRAISAMTFVIDAADLPTGDGSKTVNVFGLDSDGAWV